ncbi:unnamed protein product [Miscanthus lutarioriparius]|uniref:Uncharacterized protein n=1 Tax=Miscanthus lutarioriparius TaxID=422564 RepID=A0A811PCN9_9POAL|nr:unnamed protein product [Miscanthus lutarioriparius]
MAVAQEQQQRAGASASSPPRICILDSAVVRPSPLPSGSAPPECSLPLTFFDVFWLSLPPVERLFLYRLAPDADVPAILSNLKTSLSQAVRVFYPLAGRLRLTPGTSNRYELYYRPGDGVAFTVAEYDAGGGGAEDDIDWLAADEPREVARIAPLVPPLPAGGAVLALPATLLPARRGLAVGVTVHHAACDGSASTHFLHTWAAAACTRADAPPPPVIDRSLLPHPRGLYDVFYRPVLATTADDEMELFKAPADQLLATFTVSKDDVQRVKDAVAAEPPLPDKYLGNCVGPALCLPPRDEVAAAGAGGVFSACAAVATSIDEAVSGIGTSGMDAWGDRVIGLARSIGMLSVAGSPRFRVYDLDLGFGRPAKVDIASVAKTGAVAVAESRRGAGGMEVGVSLPRDGMDMFHKCFADAIAAGQNQS